MTSNGSIRLICFDLGGVIVRICRTWKEACLAAGLDLRGPWQHDAPAPPEMHAISIAFSTGKIDFETWCHRMSESLNRLYVPHEIARAHKAVLLGEYEGVSEAIDRIHASGLHTATLSNTDAQHWIDLIKYPAIRKINHLHASHLLQQYKPDPAIYHAFEQQVQATPHEILFLDDLPANIESALALGWHAELIDPYSRTDAQIIAAIKKHHAV